MICKNLNKRIIEVWKKNFDGQSTRTPLFFGELKKECLLFVSLNPSFSDGGFKTILRDTKYEGMNHGDFFSWKPDRKDFEEYIEICIDIDTNHARKKYPKFFGKMDNFAKCIGMDYEHIDLFFHRETEQKSFKKEILNGNELNEFGRCQMEIAWDAITCSDPKVVVVANAFGSDLIKKEWHDRLTDFDDKIGTYWIELNDKKISIFFSSMLTGQRALDKGSLERLKWHVKNVLDKSGRIDT
ncbi:MAG: hypothetical protein COV70_03710 [Parcubacteria group bacterium CG11_big_fil_rev_8_21_14_0_20_39_22]|nr:MAG: hypothetical protein COV70_03710 [Parcubacteria group bacterium CG11_big_fil_rev_8_21_14_0_20_39_22]